MSRNSEIILSAVVAIAAISTLFAVVNVDETFVISYVFADIAICGIVGTLCAYGKGSSKAVAGLSYIYTSVVYAVLNVIFSVIACVITLAPIWTLVVHIILLAVFAIRIIGSNAASDYVNVVDEKAEDKHNEFLKEKENYWK